MRDIDRQAELDAFQLAYKDELDALAKHIGRTPILRWGMTFTYSH